MYVANLETETVKSKSKLARLTARDWLVRLSQPSIGYVKILMKVIWNRNVFEVCIKAKQNILMLLENRIKG